MELNQNDSNLNFNSELSSLKHFLSEDIINLLIGHNIKTVTQFSEEDVSILKKITNLEDSKISIIKNYIKINHGSKITGNAFEMYKKLLQNKSRIIPTGIKNLDNLLNGGLEYGGFYEICGNSSSGKTTICTTITINSIKTYGISVCYIDTKEDFSSLLVSKILNSYKISDNEIGLIMRKIRVFKIKNAKNLINLLETLILNDNSYNLIIIDSLPSIWLSYTGDENNEGSELLTKTACLLKKLLSLEDKIVITVNTLTRYVSFDVENIEDDKSLAKSSLGIYWESIPMVRISIEQKTLQNCELFDNFNDISQRNELQNVIYSNLVISNQRLIKIMKCYNLETEKYCTVTINEMGIV